MNNTGMLETLVAALSEAVKKGVGRKNLVAITAIIVLSMLTDSSFRLCVLIAGVAIVAVFTQFLLDLYEVRKTGADQVDNGHSQTQEAADAVGGTT